MQISEQLPLHEDISLYGRTILEQKALLLEVLETWKENVEQQLSEKKKSEGDEDNGKNILTSIKALTYNKEQVHTVCSGQTVNTVKRMLKRHFFLRITYDAVVGSNDQNPLEKLWDK